MSFPSTLAIPGESLVLPLLILAARAGLIDGYAVQILPGTANAVAILLFHRFFARLPRELIEAARMDGLSFFQIYLRIAMPLSRPVIAAVANAIYDATGVRMRRAPFRSERVLAALEAVAFRG